MQFTCIVRLSSWYVPHICYMKMNALYMQYMLCGPYMAMSCMYWFTCSEIVCCVSKQTIHIQQTVVTVHHHPQHTLGQAGQSSDVIRQSLNVIINQLESGLCSTLTVQGISDPCHERVTGASSCPVHPDNTGLHCGRIAEHWCRVGTPWRLVE